MSHRDQKALGIVASPHVCSSKHSRSTESWTKAHPRRSMRGRGEGGVERCESACHAPEGVLEFLPVGCARSFLQHLLGVCAETDDGSDSFHRLHVIVGRQWVSSQKRVRGLGGVVVGTRPQL